MNDTSKPYFPTLGQGSPDEECLTAEQIDRLQGLVLRLQARRYELKGERFQHRGAAAELLSHELRRLVTGEQRMTSNDDLITEVINLRAEIVKGPA